MLSSHRIPVLTRAHSIVLPEHLPEISDIGEPRVIRDFRYRTVFFPEQLCRILQPRNRGLEVSLNFIPVKTKSFTWDTGINFSTNTNELVSLSNGKYSSNGYTDLGDTYAPIQQKTHRVQEGMAIGNFWGYKSIDIDENGHWIIEGADGKPKPIAEQQADDKKVLGNGLPDWYLNWNNTFRYKQFDLSITMRGAFGFQILNMPEMNYAAPVSLGLGNVMEKAFDNVYGKRPLAADQELQYVSYYVQDGDYWKIDNLTIGYTPADST